MKDDASSPHEPGQDAAPNVPPDAVEMPLPSDLRIVFQGGLFVLALVAALYVTAEIVLPLILAFVLKLLLQPAMRFIERLRVPRMLGALLLIGLLIGAVVGLGAILSGPATTWAAKLPQGLPRLQERLGFLQRPVEAIRLFLEHAQGVVGGGGHAPAAATGPSLFATLFTGTRAVATSLFTTALLLFFLLLSGDTFLRRIVEILPRFGDKRQAVDMAQHIERDISAYLVTITIMNAAVGVATAAVTWLCGLGDPVLWGAVAFLLNYVPILGPLINIVLLTFAGLLTVDTLWQAFLPAALYFAIHLVEGETVTPMLLARRFTLNPVLVLIALIFWYWMWGVPGAILAVPMLAITKIICDRIRPLAAFGHFLEG